MEKLSIDTSYEYFYENFLIKNVPCIFEQKLTLNWRSRHEWVLPDGCPNLHYLQDAFGESIVPVANCNEQYYNSNPKVDMTLAQYLDYIKKVRLKQYHYSQELKCLYLKDWHFMKQYPAYETYEIPVYFESDWLNEFCEKRNDSDEDDYRFVYFGPQYSRTPLHTDVFGSFSWSANICGCKDWILIPPGKEEDLKEANNGIFPNNVQQIVNYEALLERIGALHIRQNTGEIIFVPSGWIHQVVNVVDTISLNHNWYNACNINYVMTNLFKACENVKREISDIHDTLDELEWFNQCQLLLKAHFGLNFSDFLDNLIVIIDRLASECTNGIKGSIAFRLKYDLKFFKEILNEIFNNDDFKCITDKLQTLEFKFLHVYNLYNSNKVI